jgi:hypothetical protein
MKNKKKLKVKQIGNQQFGNLKHNFNHQVPREEFGKIGKQE